MPLPGKVLPVLVQEAPLFIERAYELRVPTTKTRLVLKSLMSTATQIPVPTVDAVQVVPPSMVRRMRPFDPTAMP